MQPYFAQKKVYIQENMEELKNELLLYPRGKHDDLLDGLYYATKKCYAPLHNKKETKKQSSYKDYEPDDISWKIA